MNVLFNYSLPHHVLWALLLSALSLYLVLKQWRSLFDCLLDQSESIRARVKRRSLSVPSTTSHSDSTVSEDSILAAVSTLFGNAELESIRKSNHLVARLVPHGQEEYQRRKPKSQVDAKQLRKHLTTPIPCLVADHNSNDQVSCFCELHVDVALPSRRAPDQIHHRVQMSMHRESNETALHSLERLSLSLQRKFQQQERAVSSSRLPRHFKNVSPHCNLQSNIWAIFPGQDVYKRLDVSEEMTCAELWQDLSKFDRCKLEITVTDDDEALPCEIPIDACPPTILSVSTFEDFDVEPFVGVPIVIHTEVLHAARAVVVWFADSAEVATDTHVYTPTSSDIGKHLSVLIIPKGRENDGSGYEEAYTFENRVKPLPSMPLVFPLRQEWTLPRQKDETLRVMSYNLLADMYTTRDIDQQAMYNHCDSAFLDRRRRMPMLAYEMLALHPDVICLQEVDLFIFERYLRPTLTSQGYQGFYSNKASSQLEGCAMFWSQGYFEQAVDDELHSFALRDLFQAEHSYGRGDSLEDIDRLLDQNTELGTVTCKKVGQVLQVAELRLRRGVSRTGPERVVIGNTHLFYHPLADHIRAMQAYMVARELDHVRRRIDHDQPLPVIFCGDLNSHPLSGVVQLLTQGRIGPENHETWQHLADYQWEMGDEEFLLEHGYIGNVVNAGDPAYVDEAFQDALSDPTSAETTVARLDLVLPHGFPPLQSAYREIPAFTNYAVDFCDTLDYILLSDASPSEPFGLDRVREAPIMPAVDMAGYVAMPNEFMPSDHISLVCDLMWKRWGEEEDNGNA